MQSYRRLLTFISYVILAVQLLLPHSAWATPNTSDFPQLAGHVVDNADVLNEQDEQTIADFLTTHEQATSDQIVVTTIDSLNGENLEEYANALFRHWGLGQKDKDNGVLLLFAMQEHKMRIEVGYGLEGELTDAKSKLIIDNLLIPAFKAENYGLGIKQATQEIGQILGSEQQYDNLEKVAESTLYGLPAGTKLPEYKRHLVDNLQLFDDKDIEEINQFLLNLEKSTASKIAIISMPLPKGFDSGDIHRYTVALAQHWGLGDKDALIILTSTDGAELLLDITVGTVLNNDYEMYYDGDEMIEPIKGLNISDDTLSYHIKGVVQRMADRIDREQNYPHLLQPMDPSPLIVTFSIASVVLLIAIALMRKRANKNHSNKNDTKGVLWTFILISFFACLVNLLLFIYQGYFAKYPIYMIFQGEGFNENVILTIISYMVTLIPTSIVYGFFYAFTKYDPPSGGSSSSSSSGGSSGGSSYSGGGGSSGGGGASGSW